MEVSFRVENEFKELKGKWKLKEEYDSIRCVRKIVDDIEEPTLGELIKESGIPFVGIDKIELVIQTCLDHRYNVITFPDFHPNQEQLILLDRWGNNINVIFHYTDNLLTMRPK